MNASPDELAAIAAMVFQHGDSALERVKELGLPTVLLVFDPDTGEIYAASYKADSLTAEQRQMLPRGLAHYLAAPRDVASEDSV